MTTSRRRTAVARAAVLAVALPLSGSLLLAAAPAAGAAINQPVDGATFETNRSVEISASYESSSGGTERLLLTSPGGPEVEIAAEPGDVSGGTLDHTLELGCWAGCRPAPNGTWKIRQEGSTSASSTFVTKIAPAAPTDLRAMALNPREVQVTWRLGPEPDLVAWDVFEGAAVVKAGVERATCEGSSCSAVVSYGSPNSGEHTYTVRAYRAVQPGSPETIGSPMSRPASVRLAAAPSASPTPAEGQSDSGSTGGSAGGTGGGSGAGSTDGSAGGSGSGTAAPAPAAPPAGATADERAVAQRKAFALGFSAFGPKLGIPKLPPLPQAEPPAIAPELADGTYEPTLGFQDQVVRERVEVAQPPNNQVRNVVGTALDSERLLRSTAAALVLLLAGAHLRRWLSASHQEQ